MQTIAEAWCGVKLEPSTVYGLRIYGNGSTLGERNACTSMQDCHRSSTPRLSVHLDQLAMSTNLILTVAASHTDKPTTHVISAILHVDHDTDEPWPIEIEDHDTGAIHAVALQPGEFLFYESATQFHSR